MCDTSATLGSIETTNAQKRRFAHDSLAFNLQDPIFCELFPELTEEIHRLLKERTVTNSSSSDPLPINAEGASLSPSLNSSSTSTSWWTNLLGNLMILALLAIFALVVRFIVNSTAELK